MRQTYLFRERRRTGALALFEIARRACGSLKAGYAIRGAAELGCLFHSRYSLEYQENISLPDLSRRDTPPLLKVRRGQFTFGNGWSSRRFLYQLWPGTPDRIPPIIFIAFGPNEMLPVRFL